MDDGNRTETVLSERIVERLRVMAAAAALFQDQKQLLIEAADEIVRLRALIVEWDDANNFGSLHGDDLTAAVDRLNATEKALIEEARRG